MSYKKSTILVAVLLSVLAEDAVGAAPFNEICPTAYCNSNSIISKYNGSSNSSNNISSGNGINCTDSNEKEALELYKNRIYAMALAKFENIRENGSTSMPASQIDGYIVLCKIHTQTAGIDETIAKYAEEYPASFMLDRIYFQYAIYLFDNSNYTKSLTFLNKVNNISRSEAPNFRFKHAYCLMRVGEQRQSASEFKSLINSIKGSTENRRYLTASEYYLGYILYSEQNFKEAIPHLMASSADQRFEMLAGYHIFECKFMLGDYDYVTKKGEKLYSKVSGEYRPKVARMLSEAYYQEKNTDKAQKYFKLYSDSGVKLTSSDNFYSGIMSYQLKMYKEAVESFKKVTDNAAYAPYTKDSKHLDSLVQSAYYFSGNSYIQLKNKYAAKDAFYKAAEMNSDKSIKEDAYFNYAKLCFDINRAVEPLYNYLNTFTYNRSKADEIHNYIATAFLLERNYAEALTALNKVIDKSPNVINNIQKASFLRGIQLVDNSGYNAAIPFFLAATENGSNEDLSNLAEFWLAESLYRTGKYTEASAQLNTLRANPRFKETEEYPLSFFNLGYINFKLGKYAEAERDFNQFLYVVPDDAPLAVEAMTRIGDCRFMTREYGKAAEIYEKAGVLNNYKDLYTPYQAAICYGLTAKQEKKTALLREITADKYSGYEYFSQSLYELGRTLVQSVKDEEAADVFNRLLKESKDSTYHYKSLLELGMIYSNLQRPDKAIAYYKEIIEKSPSSEEAESALAGLESICQTLNRQQEFLDYIDQIGLSERKSASERETIIYNAAEQTYLNGSYAKAATLLNNFMAEYPNSQYLANANFYLGESYKRQDKPEDAIAAYKGVMEEGEGAFSELATLNYAELSYKLQKYEQSLKGYETLQQIAKLDNNKLLAATGIMHSAFRLKNYDLAIKNALIVTKESPKAAQTVKDEAQLILAKCYMLTGDTRRGEQQLVTLAKKPKTAIGAEANYLLITSAYNGGEFEKLEELVFQFSDSGTQQTYWLAKSFIILGDSYYDQNNIGQAEATYKSIKENYTPQEKEDDVFQQLDVRFKKLESKK